MNRLQVRPNHWLKDHGGAVGERLRLRRSPGAVRLSETRKNTMSIRRTEPDTETTRCLPHGRVLLDGMALTPERLRTGSKVAVSLLVLRAVLSAAVSQLPFDAEFYRRTYPDIQSAYAAGQIEDLRSHFVETGYFEGRLGAEPGFDEQFYKTSYPDVVEAIATGAIGSAFEHYVRAGASEGRHANASDVAIATRWRRLFQPADVVQAGNGSRR